MKKRPKTKPKSLGTSIAEKARAKANNYTHEKRNGLLEQGVAKIYGGTDHAKSADSRR